jgi:hypothetical protein
MMMYFIMDMLSNCLWMIAFHNCYYMQLFFIRILVFSSARWPTKILQICFHRPAEPTKILPLFSSAVLADENVNIFSSAVLADENKVIFVYFIRSV